MKNFNWEEFKKGNVEVSCKTKESSKNFLMNCIKQGIRRGDKNKNINLYDVWDTYKEDTVYGIWRETDPHIYYRKIGGMYYGDSLDDEKQIIEWSIEKKECLKTKFSFEEIVNNKKPNQIWIGDLYILVTDSNSDLEISLKSNRYLSNVFYIGCSTDQYELLEKVSFQDAVKECEENGKKVMKSYISDSIYRVCDYDFQTRSIADKTWVRSKLNYEEIKGAWLVYEI